MKKLFISYEISATFRDSGKTYNRKDNMVFEHPGIDSDSDVRDIESNIITVLEQKNPNKFDYIRVVVLNLQYL